MASSPVLPPNRHVEFKKGGWGAAILTTAAAVATFLTAWYIHEQTYRHPTDLMMRTYPRTDAAHGAEGGHGGEGSHGAAPAAGGDHGAPAAGGAAAPAGGAGH